MVEVRSLLLKRSLSVNGEQHVKSEPASAAVFKERGRIRLVVSGAFELDYFGEHASSQSPLARLG